MDYTTLFALIISVVGWVVIYYAGKKWQTGENLDVVDFVSTVIVAVVVGVVGFMSSSPVNQEGIVAQIEVYAPVIAFLDYVLKAVYSYLYPPISSPRNKNYRNR